MCRIYLHVRLCVCLCLCVIVRGPLHMRVCVCACVCACLCGRHDLYFKESIIKSVWRDKYNMHVCVV